VERKNLDAFGVNFMGSDIIGQSWNDNRVSHYLKGKENLSFVMNVLPYRHPFSENIENIID
jgi:hypothetical protein